MKRGRKYARIRDGGKDGRKEERDIRGRDHNKHVQNEKWNQIYNENSLEI